MFDPNFTPNLPESVAHRPQPETWSALRRVVFTIGQLQRGGTEQQLVLLAGGLRKRGLEVTVISLFDGGPRAEDLRAADVPVRVLGLPKLRGNQRQWPRLAHYGRFISWLRGLRPQVVHAFLFQAYVLTPPAARAARVPVLVAGRRSLADFKNGNRLAFGIERLATRMTDLVVANCDAVREDAIRRERLTPDKIVVIRNGLSPAAFGRHDAEPVDRPPVLLCVANLIGYKGHRHLLEAAALLHRRGVHFRLLLAGDGPERTGLERQAACDRLPVWFLGARSDVPALLAAADVVVLASLQEGLSNALMEAMAAGKPVVATDVGGNREALGATGLLVPPSDPPQLAAAIERLLRDRGLTCRLGEAARERARHLFPVDAMVDRHLELYGRLHQRCAASRAS
jgi:glycosyltransferase involved in cell wall biosynthesis